MYERTWEPLIEPDSPIPVSDLEIRVSKGSPLTLAADRPKLYKEALDYWNASQAKIAKARSDEIISALQSGDEDAIAKIMKMIGGVSPSQRLTYASLRDKSLSLAISGTNYMEFIGTNEQAINNEGFRKRLMDAGFNDYADENAYFANPLAACTVINGVEGGKAYAIVGVRSNKVAIYPNVHHVSGGLVDIDEDCSHLSFKNHVEKELQEEVGLDENEFSSPMLYAMIRQLPSRHPEAVLGVTVKIGKGELMERWKKSAPDKFEHRNLSFYTTDEIPQFLETFGHSMVPSGAAALEYVMRYKEAITELV